MAQELALGKRAEDAARLSQALDLAGSAFDPNARRLAQRPDIRARVRELQQREAELSEVNLDWLKLKLKRFLEYNVDDYLSPPDENGERHYDIRHCTRAQLEALAAVIFTRQDVSSRHDIESGVKREIVHTGIKPHDIMGAAKLMAQLLGSVEEPARNDGTSVTFNILGLPIEDQRLIASALQDEPAGPETPALADQSEHREA